MTKELRVLIIDDDLICQKALEFLLIDNYTCIVKAVFSSTEAFDHIQQEAKINNEFRYDIIFVDIHLPDIEGYELIEILNKLELTKESKIIGITADEKFEQKFYQKLCLDNGISNTIIKPITLEKIKHFFS